MRGYAGGQIARFLCRVVVVLVCLTGCGAPEPENRDSALVTATLHALAGRHARVVWVRDLGDNTDVTAQGNQLRLMGFDSEDGRGERVILPGPGNFFRPLITPSGKRIIFSDFSRRRVEIVDWSGENRKFLTSGRVLAVSRDVETGRVWAYVGRGEIKNEPGPGSRQLYRIDLEHPEREELLWDRAEFGDVVQVSGDGKKISVEVSRAGCGLIDIEQNDLDRKDRGCWPAIAPDDSGRFWCFERSHKVLALSDPVTGKIGRVSLTGVAGIDGHEVYHPRWSNHPRFLVISGPYTIRRGGNNIRGGGPGVEIFAGRFTPDFSRVDAWFQVSRNNRADFFPDLWVTP